MDFPQDQVEELKSVHSGVLAGSEAGTPYFLIPKIRLPEHCRPGTLDIVLCPVSRDGYPTRLYFSERVERPPHPNPNKKLNWTGTVHVMGRTWQVLSWRVGAGAAQRLAQMVAAHLEPFE